MPTPALPWILAGMLLASCGRSAVEQPVYELAGTAMGTSFSVKVAAPPDDLDRDALKTRISALLGEIEKSMSTYDADSELSRFNAHPGTGWYDVSKELCDVVAAAQEISAISYGAFDVTVGPLVDLWGFGPGYSADDVPSAERIAEIVRQTGNGHLQTDCSQPALRKSRAGLSVDLSGYAKGYGVDRVARLVSDAGVRNYLVEIGGEIRAAGTNSKQRPWSIAIESPDRTSRSVARVIGLSDAAMASSGDYRNFFERDGRYYSHLIDPRSGYPVSHNAAAVTVIADSAAFADGMATALLVLGPTEGLELAESRQLAALFQLRVNGGVQQRMSTRFEKEVRPL